jgi:hypothetical protein
MGIGFVLVLWAVVGMILAGIGAGVLGAVASYFTRYVGKDGRKAVIAAILFPFACLGWAGMIFVFQALVNEEVFQRDPGMGDTWKCPLPNGYALLMIDEPDQGVVYKPVNQHVEGVVGIQQGAVDGIRIMQVAGRYILGGADSRSSDHFGDKAEVDSYFLLDTGTGERQSFSTYEALRTAAGLRGVQLALQPIEAVYDKYRFTYFDKFVGCLLCVPPVLLAWLLVRWIVRLRGRRDMISQPA